MSTSLLYHAYGIKGVQHNTTKYENGCITYFAEMTKQKISCPKCCCKNSCFKGKKTRQFKMVPIGSKKCFLNLILHRLQCTGCGHQWWPRLSFMKGKHQMTRAFIQYAFDLVSIGTIKDIANLLGVNWNVIKDIHKMKLEKLYTNIPLEDVEYISVDEFAIKKGHTYMTVFTDIRLGRVIHAVEGRKIEDITPFLLKLKKEAPRLKGVAMDMSVPYIAAIEKVLPHIDIVFDHFHVKALMNKALDEIRKEQQVEMNRADKGVLKGNRFLLLKNYGDLAPESKSRLQNILEVNKPLFQAHCLKEQFQLFWEQKSLRHGFIFLNNWIDDARATGIKKLQKLADTLDKHMMGLLNYFKHHITNAKAEGINNKIKTMKRQAYGFRDMKYFKLRLYHLHEQRYAFVG